MDEVRGSSPLGSTIYSKFCITIDCATIRRAQKNEMQNLPLVVPQGQELTPHVSTKSRHAALRAAFAWPRRGEANAKPGFILWNTKQI